MQVGIVNKNQIEIHLSEREITDIFGGYEYIDYNKLACRAKIHGIIIKMLPDALLPFDCKRILIEVKPSGAGCIISLTKIYDLNTSNKETVIMIFENSEDLVLAMKVLKGIKFSESALYCNGQKYALICGVKAQYLKSALHISEYCKTSHRRIDAMKIKEYWQPICKTHAISKLIGAFLE